MERGIKSFKEASRKQVEEFVLNYEGILRQWRGGRKYVDRKMKVSWYRR